MICLNSTEKVIERTRLHDIISEKDVCPKCGGELIIDENKRMYICKKCKNGGLAPTFLMEKTGKNFTKVIEELAEKSEIKLEKCIFSREKYSLEKCKKCNLFKN